MSAPDLTNSDPLINRTIEGYEFIKRLGEGTYGIVYLARHPRIKERLVAVKYIKLSNPREAQKVEREVDILARLQHPNVVDIYDSYRFDHYQLVVMELIRGGSLRDSLQQIEGLLDLNYVTEGVEQLAFALGYVHDQSILHLDLKPANILLDPVAEGQMARFVLTDFGIAQIMQPNTAMSSHMMGTPMYMSPEHFGFGDSKPDHRSDIYSLGVILYELVTGHVPYQSSQLLDLLNQHAYSPVPIASQEVPHLPPALDNIILKAMAKSPADRFQSAGAMGSALRELRQGALLDLLTASQPGVPARVSGRALGALAQAGAEALELIGAEYPSRQTDTRFRLLIMKPDGSQDTVGFSEESVTVGRDQAADLQLAHSTVSRRHLQIDCDRKGHIYITDLQSVNGTYLDGIRLPPQERVRWQPDQFVQIQGFLLQIIAPVGGQGAAGPQIATTNQVLSLLDRLEHQHRKPAVRMDISPAIVYAELGKPQYIQVRVATENTPSARYELRAKPGPGLDKRWYTLPAPQMIESDASYTFDFIISMPPVGTTGDATHEIALQVVADNPEIPTAYQVLKVRVMAFTRFTVTLHPNEVSHNRRRRAELLIANTGNQPETFSIETEAPDTLKVEPQAREIEIAPSEEKSVRLNFRPARDARRLRTRLIYTVSVRVPSGLVERANGSYIFPRRGRVPWTIIVLWIVLVVVAGRLVILGVSIPDQFAELRAVIEALVVRLRGG